MSSKTTERKRDRLRSLFRGRGEASSGASIESRVDGGAAPWNQNGSPTSTSPPASTSQQSGNPSTDFYTAALKKLDAKEQLVLREHVASNIADAVQAAYIAASKQKKICEDKRWSGSDRANKVLLWLDRFKSVGDIAANADPLHVGLPWAGIRMLLEAAVADNHQMTALMSGMDLALCIANRLRAYFTYFQRLPPSLTTDNLHKALVALFAHLLHFLARAIQTYSMNPAMRKVQALWQNPDLTSFQDRCDKLGGHVDIEANNCDRDLRAREWGQQSKWKVDLDATLRKLETIQLMKESIDTLQVKVDLSKLVRVQEATYNSSAEEKLSLCLDGTRLDILHNITQWAGKPDGQFIFWLCGKAGTGKSTISRTVAQKFDRQRHLGASFFFKRGEKNRSNADHFFSTIAAQLADLIPQLQAPIATALDRDSFLCGKGLQNQFEELLLRPLLSLNHAHLPRHSVVIVIDALDECDRNTDIRVFLKYLARLGVECALQLRIFVTSRPEVPIQLGFRRLDDSLHRDILLEEVQEQSIRRDIRAYFDSEFAKMREERLLLRPRDALPADWPGDDDLQTLVGLAVPLFIFASTVCRFVSGSTPQRRLKIILEQRYSAGTSHLAKTYLPILDQLLFEEDEEEQKEKLLDFRAVVGPIILAAEPLSIASLINLLRIDQERINDILQRLHSVLQVGSSLHTPVRLLHLSFRDFLVDPKRRDKDRFWMNEMETHKQLAYHCLRRLGEPNTLKSDVCHVHRPGTRRTELTSEQIAAQIPSDVAYACSHWSYHLAKSGEQLCDRGQAHQFLRRHFLHWLEVLSWIGKLPSVILCIDDLLSIEKGQECHETTAFLVDAKRFILSHRLTIDIAPLQIYHSALMFTPGESVVRNTFRAELPKSWSLVPSMPLDWNAEILKFEGFDAGVMAIAFSPDGQDVASASSDKTVRLWNAQSGAEKRRLRVNDINDITWCTSFFKDNQIVYVTPRGPQFWDAQTGEQLWSSGAPPPSGLLAVFTPDAEAMATSLYSCMVHLFDTKTGKQMHCLEGHLSCITALAFSPDGHVIASGSIDGTIQMWDAITGVRKHKFTRHKNGVARIAFAPDGLVAASASGDGTMQLWNVRTSEQMHTFPGHMGPLVTMTFLHDGEMIVSTSVDQTIQSWDVWTGKQCSAIEGSECEKADELLTTAVSPVEKIVAVAGSDGSVQLREIETGECRKRLEGHDDLVKVLSFSPDGQLIASASDDGTVRLWNVQTGERIQTFRQSADDLLILFSPDGQVVAFVQWGVGELWNTQTGMQTYKLKDPEQSQAERTIGAAFSPDGRMIAITLSDSTVWLWDVQTGRRIFKFRASRDHMAVMVLSPDSQTMASGSKWGHVRLWNLEQRELMHKFQGYDKAISAIALSWNGQKIAIVSHDGTVRLWNAQTCEQISQFEAQGKSRDRSYLHTAVAFSPDDKVLAVSFDEMLQLRDVQTGLETQRIRCHKKEEVTTMTFSSDGQLLAVSAAQVVQLWDMQKMEQTREFKGHTDRIIAMAFSPGGQQIASASDDGTVRLWNIQHRSMIQKPEGHQDRVFEIALSSDGRVAASVSDDKTLRLWNTGTGDETQRFQDDGIYSLSEVAFSPDGKTIALGAYGKVLLWNTETGKEMQRLQAHNPTVERLIFSPDGKIIALTTKYPHPSVQLRDTQTSEQVDDFDQLDGLVSAVAFSPDGQLVASSSYPEPEASMRLWKIQKEKKLQMLRSFSSHSFLPTMLFSPDSQTIVLTTYVCVEVWNVQTGECMQTLRDASSFRSTSPCFDATNRRSIHARFSRNGRYVYTNFGTFVLEWTQSGMLVEPLPRTTGLELNGEWIQHHGQDLVYLPRDFHGTCMDTHEDVLAIGQASGAVNFFRLKK